MTRKSGRSKSAARTDAIMTNSTTNSTISCEERIRDVLRLDSVSSTSTYIQPSQLPAAADDSIYENSDIDDVKLRPRKLQQQRGSDAGASGSKNVRRWKVGVRDNASNSSNKR